MDGDLNHKIKEIGSMFGLTELPENIGDLVSTFLASSGENHTESPEEAQTGNGCCAETAALPAPDIGHTNNLFGDIDMAKVLKLLKKYQEAKNNQAKDKKIQLLYAVEPFLNEKRKDKVGSCVKFLTFAALAKEFKDI